MKMIIFEVLILNVLVYIKERFKNKDKFAIDKVIS
jgi:hypothetical protein